MIGLQHLTRANHPVMLTLFFELFILLLLSSVRSSWQEKENKLVPLVIWPGMGDSCCYVFGAAGYQGVIQRMVPNMYIRIIAFGKTPQEDSYNSFFLNSNTQVDLACQLLSADPKLKDGFNAMGFSQGSQFLRALVQRCDKVKIFNLISAGGQHQGVYGFPFCIGEKSWYCDLFRKFLSIGVYLTLFQDYLVQASYWHDPHDEESYQLDCLFLSDINQEVKFNHLYKERLSKLSNFVLIKFEQDMMVQPRETQWFGFYKPGQAIETYSLYESKIFTKDLLGLKHLHKEGRLHLLSSPNGHTLLTYEWLDNYVIPFIKRNYTNVHQPVNIGKVKEEEKTEKGDETEQEKDERSLDKERENEEEKFEKGKQNLEECERHGKNSQSLYSKIQSAHSSHKIITNINQPFAISTTSNGTVFICGDKLIHQFDSFGNTVGTTGPIEGDVRDITIHNDNLYVVVSDSIYRYSLTTGQYTDTIYKVKNKENYSVHGVSIDDEGLLYISHDGNNLISIITQEGHHLRDLTLKSSPPQKIQFDMESHIRVIDASNKHIYVLTKCNQILRIYPTKLITPQGLYIDNNDNMIIADRQGIVTVYDNSGRMVHTILGFEGCGHVHVSPNNTLWVTDTIANKVYIFQL